jgi:RNA-directed DNA polymerase
VYEPHQRAALADELADAFLRSPWKVELIAESGAARLDRWPSWLEGLALMVVAVHRSAPVDRRWELVGLIEEFLAERRPVPGELEPPQIARLQPPRAPDAIDRRWPVAARSSGRPGRRWPVTELATVDALAEQLELSDGQLAWLADVRGLERRAPDERLRNYRYAAVRRRSGLPRVIEAPKARLKEVQRWILREILDHVPAHDAAHGFTRGRSAVTHARLHTRQAVVLRLDLRDFFASVGAGRVAGLFRRLGYAPLVARVLTGLSTNAVPVAVWAAIPAATEPRLIQPHFWLGRRLATPHLPQGAPTSPALANLLAFGLDRRLAGLAQSSGMRYSRYADDLSFSGPSLSRDRRRQLESLVASIVADEGFRLNADKSALATAGGRQVVCGVVVNRRTNVARGEYDRMRAILHNAARHGPAGQNRSGAVDFEAHLRGRISWVASLHPARGEKLRRRFEQIDWSR